MTGQAQYEACPHRDSCVPPETSPVRLDHLTAERQPEPHTAQLAGFEGLEQMLCDVR